MTYSQQSHEAAVVRYPMPDLPPHDNTSTDADVQDAIDQARNATLDARDLFASNVEGASDATNKPPLITAIEQVTYEIREFEEARRRLIAFGRHGVSGKPHSYVSLGAAAGRSDVWAKEVSEDPAARAAALAAQAELRPNIDRLTPRDASDDTELFAMVNFRDLLDDTPVEQRPAVLSTLTVTELQTLHSDLTDAAATRVVTWLHDRYATAEEES